MLQSCDHKLKDNVKCNVFHLDETANDILNEQKHEKLKEIRSRVLE